MTLPKWSAFQPLTMAKSPVMDSSIRYWRPWNSRTSLPSATGVAQVLLLDADQRVGQQPVQLGAVQNDRWIVTGGLKPGDRIVTEGLQHAKPGDKVQIDDTPLPLAQVTGK